MSFAPTIFGPELARILNTLAAVHVEESKRYNKMENLPLMGVFTNPVGTSWFEADMLTRHFYANHASLESLLSCDCVPGAREALEWHQGEAVALSMLQTRQMLLARFVEVASSLQAGVGPALASVPAQPVQPGQPVQPDQQPVQPPPVQPPPPPPAQPATRWPLRQHGPLFGMIRQAEHPPPRPAAAPLPMQPWRCPVMVPISFFNDQGRAWEMLPPPMPCPQFAPPPQQQYPSFRMAETSRTRTQAPGREGGWEPDPSRASSLAPSLAPSLERRGPPSPEAHTSPDLGGDAMETGSRPQSPRPPGPPAAPAVPPRREPRWLVPRADSVPPSTPGSENTVDPRVRLEPPNLNDGGWFSGEEQEE